MMRTITIKNMVEIFGIELFDFDYNYLDRDNFEQRFKDEYWFRNIGFETTDMFLHYLRVEVQRLSPKYNRVLSILESVEVELERGSRTKRTYDDKGNEVGQTSNVSSSKTSGDREYEGVESDEINNESTIDETSTSMNQELGYQKLDEVDFDNINNAIRTINNILSEDKGLRTKNSSGSEFNNSEMSGNLTEDRSVDKTNSGFEEIVNTDIPLYEAIDNLKRIEMDVTYEFIKELNNLFSLVYY